MGVDGGESRSRARAGAGRGREAVPARGMPGVLVNSLAAAGEAERRTLREEPVKRFPTSPESRSALVRDNFSTRGNLEWTSLRTKALGACGERRIEKERTERFGDWECGKGGRLV